MNRKFHPSDLVRAAKFDKIEEVQEILGAGINPNDTGYWGKRALATAIEYGHSQIVNILLNAGSDPNLGHEMCCFN